jgi:hypothetical protein
MDISILGREFRFGGRANAETLRTLSCRDRYCLFPILGLRLYFLSSVASILPNVAAGVVRVASLGVFAGGALTCGNRFRRVMAEFLADGLSPVRVRRFAWVATAALAGNGQEVAGTPER